MTKDEALTMALEALEAHADIGIKSDKAITAIKEALAQPEQEPVASDAYDMIDRFLRNNLYDDDYAEYSSALDNLFTPPPPKRQPLTDEEIDNLGRKEKDALLNFIYENGTATEGNDYFFKKYARVILAAEAKLQENNK